MSISGSLGITAVPLYITVLQNFFSAILLFLLVQRTVLFSNCRPSINFLHVSSTECIQSDKSTYILADLWFHNIIVESFFY